MNARRKALVLLAGMAGAAVLAEVGKPRRSEAEAAALAIRLESVFPRAMGGWQVDATRDMFVRPADQQGKVYGFYDQVLERVYVGPEGEQVMLSIAYGAEQSASLQVHRPEICYAGGGFKVQGLHREAMALAGQSVSVTRLHATRPGRSEPITYWTVLGGEAVQDGGSFRLRQLAFGLRGHMLDGMLVRISSIDADAQHAYQVHERFAQALAAAIDPAMRPRVIGGATRKP
jgi:EpsI family protein